MMILVDKSFKNRNKEINNEKSVFSIGDFRHNLVFKTDSDVNMSKVSKNPKEFFKWNDDREFNPKYKHDKILKK
jgi:hypothetical protein